MKPQFRLHTFFFTVFVFFSVVCNAQLSPKDSIGLLHQQVKEEAFDNSLSALKKADRALYLSKANALPKEELQSYYSFGLIYYFKGYYNLSNDYYRIITKSKHSDSKQLSAAWNNMGINFEMTGHLDSALYCYQESQKIDKSLGDDVSENMVLINMGLLNHKLSKSDKAFKQTHEAQSFFNKKGDKENLALCYMNLGLFHNDKRNYDSCAVYYGLAEKIYEELGDKMNLCQVKMDESVMWIALKNKAKAQKTTAECLAILRETPNPPQEASWNSIYGIYHEKFGSLDSAIYYSRLAITGFDSLEMQLSLEEEYFFLAEYFAEKGDIMSYRSVIEKRDSVSKAINQKEQATNLAEMEVRYKLDMNNLKVLNTEKLLDEKKTQILVISIFTITLFVALLLTYRLYVRVKQANKNLYDRNVELAQKENTPKTIQINRTQQTPETNDLLSRFERLLAENEYYKKPDLSLKMAAQELGSNEKYLSQAVNMGEDNFNTFVNRFRVNEARRIILDGNHNQTSVEEIGLMVGFTNRHTFSRAFTQITGISPSEFRKIHLSH